MRVLLATDRPDLGHALSVYLTAHLFDWRLGEAAATAAIAGCQGGGDPTPVVILCTLRESAPARTSGAAAYVTLGDPPDSLLAALTEVAPRAL